MSKKYCYTTTGALLWHQREMEYSVNRTKALAIAVLVTALAAGAYALPRQRMKAPARPRNQVAVVRSKYDDVAATLQQYRIPHDLLYYRDLENPERVAAYRSLFIPSGVDNLLEEGLDVYANNFRFRSVTLKPDFYEVDRDKVALTLRRFVKGGGSAYLIRLFLRLPPARF